MATPRTEKTTIPAGRDPLAGLAFEQNKPQPPIDKLITDTSQEAKQVPAAEPRRKVEAPAEDAPEQKTPKGKMTVLVENDLLERVRNAAWWQRKTLATLAEEGLRLVVERLERQHGGPFEQREEDLKTGRPQGSKNGTTKAR